MKIIKFKTNINCGECIAKVTPFLDGEDRISMWKVDTKTPDKILSVSGNEIEPHHVKNLVEEAGFKAEVLRVQGIEGGDI
jgi:copper chaperone